MLTTYDRIRIVNLPERTDRRREMIGELKRIGLAGDSRVEFMRAIAPQSAGPWDSRGAQGAYMSHLTTLKEAEAANASVLILEDDCDFTDAAAVSNWGGEADIFYGGYYAHEPSDLPASIIVGAHCMGFHRRVLPRLVPYLEQLAQTASPPPIDGAYVNFRHANPDVTVSFASPPIAIQRQSRSDIAPSRFDRSATLSWMISLLRRFNRERNRRHGSRP